MGVYRNSRAVQITAVFAVLVVLSINAMLVLQALGVDVIGTL
jgi:hypothetical protein